MPQLLHEFTFQEAAALLSFEYKNPLGVHEGHMRICRLGNAEKTTIRTEKM